MHSKDEPDYGVKLEEGTEKGDVCHEPRKRKMELKLNFDSPNPSYEFSAKILRAEERFPKFLIRKFKI